MYISFKAAYLKRPISVRCVRCNVGGSEHELPSIETNHEYKCLLFNMATPFTGYYKLVIAYPK